MAERITVNSKKPVSIKENLISHKRKTDFRSNSSPVNRIQYLQRTIGNQAVQRMVRSGALQAKLRVGQPGDVYEQEADRVADAVMRMPETGVQRQVEPEEEEEETLQTKPLASQITPFVQRQVEEEEEEEMLQAKSREDATSEVPNDLESQINAIRSGGRSLAESERAYFEPRFGVDFSRVRVHTDTRAADSARAVNARAFTMGQDVVFGTGQYSPGTASGNRLLAHELTHVIQQGSQPDPVNKKVLQRQMRRATAADTAPACTNVDFVVPPAAEHDRVDKAIAIIERVVNNPRDYPRCPTHFKDHCSPGTDTSLQDQYNRAIIWKAENYPDEWLGATCVTPNIGYTYHSYRWSHWAIAASLVHEMMHICGVVGHPASTQPGYSDICDEAKHWCGRLPDL